MTTTNPTAATEPTTSPAARPPSKARRRLRYAALRALVAHATATDGYAARAALLAYAYARGLPYRRAEPVTRQAKEYASAPTEAYAAELHAAWRRALARRIAAALAGRAPATGVCPPPDPAAIAAWLAVPEEPARAAARAAALTAWRARGAEVRAAHAAARAGRAGAA